MTARGKYDVNGEQLTSVTTILREVWPAPCLVDWRIRQVAEAAVLDRHALQWTIDRKGNAGAVKWLVAAPARIGNRSQGRGSRVHSYIEAVLLDREPPVVSVEDEPWCQAFDKFRADHELTPVLIEHQVARPGSHAGTLDLIAETERGLALGDWKSTEHGADDGGHAVYEDMVAQLGGYSLCTLARVDKDHPWAPLDYMQRCQVGMVVKLCGDGTYGLEWVDLEIARERFELALELYQIITRDDKRWRMTGPALGRR